jgi:hypothetical protein
MLKVELHHLFFEPNDFHNKKGNTHQSIEKEKKMKSFGCNVVQSNAVKVLNGNTASTQRRKQ